MLAAIHRRHGIEERFSELEGAESLESLTTGLDDIDRISLLNVYRLLGLTQGSVSDRIKRRRMACRRVTRLVLTIALAGWGTGAGT